MERSVRQFNVALRRFFDQRAPEEVAVVQRKICLDALRSLVKKTPWDTGRARAGWQVGIDERPEGQTEGTDKSGSATVRAGNQKISRIKWPVVCYLVNNVEYIGALENGHSQKAPNGMLAVTVQELQESLK